MKTQNLIRKIHMHVQKFFLTIYKMYRDVYMVFMSPLVYFLTMNRERRSEDYVTRK